MPYVALVSVVLYDRRMSTAIFTRQVSLPYPVVIGAELGFTGARDDAWSGEVIDMVTDVDGGVTHLVLEDWLSERLTLEEMIAELGPHWKRLSAAA